MNTITFFEKVDAHFCCEKQQLQNFKQYLKQNHIEVVATNPSYSNPTAGLEFFDIEVVDVDPSEAKELISKFNG